MAEEDELDLIEDLVPGDGEDESMKKLIFDSPLALLGGSYKL